MQDGVFACTSTTVSWWASAAYREPYACRAPESVLKNRCVAMRDGGRYMSKKEVRSRAIERCLAKPDYRTAFRAWNSQIYITHVILFGQNRQIYVFPHLDLQEPSLKRVLGIVGYS